MNLIAYSDSESDGEAAPTPKPALKQAPKSSFQKVVDRANPGRIKVSLPGASQAHTAKDDIEDDAPPAKKPRLGGASAFGGFNAMLPAPKKPAAAPASSSATPGKRALGKGLASGVNLKTGAEPAFKRESRVEAEDYDENGNPVKKEPMNKDDFRALLNLPPPKSEKKEEVTKEAMTESIPAEPQAIPKPAAPRFVPMSVGKGKKKKPAVPRTAAPSSSGTASSASASANTQSNTAPAAPVRKPKVSLFGVSQETTAPAIESGAGAYEPMLYGARDEDDPEVPDEAFDGNSGQQPQRKVHAAVAPPSNDLTNMATELHLSEAERRQLFGKKGREADFSAAKIVEFNTDTEYAHNEKLRQQGEQVQHNALKSISGTGKNSLRSLVNVASTQKDALEEHFAAGYRNKKEAGNRYGW
ncbi:mitotic checkpoint regulator, MAD2B-interacting-domain-containing protein [Paraphoma chrysanthemicola]|uniref:Mitotic checkpoint regulator, MAD2B-interacting-domain-containing protein n=1 Tax=Paraphoma chrysanthemicola TaxID=798071 RepID=A0A8K0QZB3_9PLEO|nr:mitotic checkpoint regulator, MAD2B-interacting-domain-containing protein [Paraphoma chrysanthemicola]